MIRRAIAFRDWKFVIDELTIKKGVREEGPISISGDEPSLLVWDDERVKNFFKDSDFSLKKISKAFVSEAERLAIMEALKETNWNRKKAAEMLQVSYKTLLNRILEFEMKP